MPRGSKPKYFGCIVYDCKEKHHARRLCQSHYQRWYVNTHPEYKARGLAKAKEWQRKHPIKYKRMIRNYLKNYWKSEAGKQTRLRMQVKNPVKHYKPWKRKGRGKNSSRGKDFWYWRQMRVLMMQYPKPKQKDA